MSHIELAMREIIGKPAPEPGVFAIDTSIPLDIPPDHSTITSPVSKLIYKLSDKSENPEDPVFASISLKDEDTGETLEDSG